ncbi:serine/threonine-protein kinase [Herbidospora mongoliensis]|uniref:serine/threonine-protein kinase n=1 Tax=Herbidospora mongoliensis TaxID=688067 RepID=UPI0008354022|nr:serine/threonine-protein kinase [Herbidospora mongoliensis]
MESSVSNAGPYRLLSPLGKGGFGEVHLALDAEGRTVAVKVLHPHIAGDASAITRLSREVETMLRVRGPHIAEVLDVSLEGDRPYIVTRYVPGRALSTIVAEGAIKDDAELLRLARGLAEALTAIHDAGIVHRDLKPANVMLADGEPFLIDFGIASALDLVSVTDTGAVVGTPGYLAPEVLEGGDAGPPADVFAFAATLAYAATGRSVYGQGPAPAVAYRVVHHEPDLSGVPSWLAPILRDALATDPAARPTAGQLLARLGAQRPVPVTTSVHREEETTEWKPGAPPPEPRSPAEIARARRADVVRRRWVIGTCAIVGLLAATGREHVPEASLLLLVVYGLALLIDAMFGLAAKAKGRVILDLSAIAGSIVLWWVLSTFFSTFILLLAVGALFFALGLLALAG